MTVNSSVFIEGNFAQSLWTISISPKHGSVTEVPYLLGTNSFGIVLRSPRFVQDSGRTVKLFCKQLYNV